MLCVQRWICFSDLGTFLDCYWSSIGTYHAFFCSLLCSPNRIIFGISGPLSQPGVKAPGIHRAEERFANNLTQFGNLTPMLPNSRASSKSILDIASDPNLAQKP